MNYLSIENVSKRYADKPLFDGISFGLDKGQKTAIIAKNGTGKTTLLKIILGKENPDSGNVVWRNGIRIGFLNQNDIFDTDKTVKDIIFENSDNETVITLRDYNRKIEVEDYSSDEYNRIFEKMNLLQGWDKEVHINQILTVFELDKEADSIKNFSGGQLKRLALAKLLIDEPDVLVLDEPTNHLDLDMIEWLEAYLSQANITLLMVTHDRYFLEAICDEIIEIDQQKAFRYKGNFSYFLEKKAEREEIEANTISKAKSLMKTELEWIRRQPKARGTKSKSRVDAFYDLKKTATQKIEKDELDLVIKSTRLGTKIIEFHNVSKSLGDKLLLDKFDYNFKREEKAGIIGKNGVGKSTFLNLITGKMTPDNGKIIIGDTVEFGYYTQKGIQLKDDKRVIEVIKDIADFIPLEKGKTISATQLLERFLFKKESHWQYVSKLSGGERKRLYLLTILMKNPNFLILDEPTNDLDIYTLSALEDYLKTFKGCLLVVSHDRYFLDKITDHVFAFEGLGKIKEISGNYTAYREYLKNIQKESNKKAEEKKEETVVIVEEKRKASYKEKKEFEEIDGIIAKLEEEKRKLEEKIMNNEVPQENIVEITTRLSEIMTEIESKEERWLELSEIVV